MKSKLVDALFFVAGITAVGIAFLALTHATDTDTDPAKNSVGPALQIDEVVTLSATPPPTPFPELNSTAEPTPLHNLSIPLSEDLQTILRCACAENGVELAIALGVIEVESCFDPMADNGQDYGLMQLNRKYFPDGLSPEENIVYGVRYLGYLIDCYGNVEAALTAYNIGHDNGTRWYANAVLEAAERWKEAI